MRCQHKVFDRAAERGHLYFLVRSDGARPYFPRINSEATAQNTVVTRRNLSMREPSLWIRQVVNHALLVLASLTVPWAPAQTAKPPDAYSMAEVNAMLGPSMTMQIDRDGAHVVVESTIATQPGAAPSASSHTRTYYDLQNHKNYTLSLSDASAACSRGDFTGDWGDPFEVAAGLMKELAPQNPKQIGAETVNGF